MIPGWLGEARYRSAQIHTDDVNTVMITLVHSSVCRDIEERRRDLEVSQGTNRGVDFLHLFYSSLNGEHLFYLSLCHLCFCFSTVKEHLFYFCFLLYHRCT